MATPEQWTVRIELALQQGNATDTQALVTEGKEPVNNPVWSQSVDALVARSEEAQRRETRADLKRTRPSSNNPEFGAVPFKDGLMFVTTSVADGFAAPKDGWTGRQFSELRQVALKDSVDRPTSFREKANKQDLSELGSTAFHNGPVAFSENGTGLCHPKSSECIDRREIGCTTWRGRRCRKMGQAPVTNGFPYNDTTFSRAHAALDTLGLDFLKRPSVDWEAWICGCAGRPQWFEATNLGAPSTRRATRCSRLSTRSINCTSPPTAVWVLGARPVQA